MTALRLPDWKSGLWRNGVQARLGEYPLQDVHPLSGDVGFVTTDLTQILLKQYIRDGFKVYFLR